MSANTLDCEVLINAVNLRLALWEQSDKTIKTETLNWNYGKKWLLNVTRLVSKNAIFLIYWLQFSPVMCCGNNTKAIYDSLSFIRQYTTIMHNFVTVYYTFVCTVMINDSFQAVDPYHYWNSECISYPSCPQIWSVIRSCDLTFRFIKTGTKLIFLVL